MEILSAMSPSTKGRWLGLALVTLLVSCEQERSPLGASICVGWKDTVGPLLDDQCVECHGGAEPAGGLALDDYVSTLPATRPRTEAAPILTVFDLDDTHRDLRGARQTLAGWVTACDAPFVSTDLHARAIMDPTSDDFHGALLRSTGYDFEDCQRCHGQDYAGGPAEASCLSCHPQGPTDCVTCHGDEMRSGAHAAHEALGALRKPSECSSCHEVPIDPLEPGHFRLARGELDPPPAEVALSGPAAWGPPEPITDRPPPGPPTYERESQTCVNVYCHGAALDDSAAERLAPTWTNDESLDCRSCHGSPPASHASDRCGDCHGAVSPAPGVLTNFAGHLDGRIQFGVGGDRCDACHGGPDGAPGPDLDGRTDRAFVTVGAHEPHLRPQLQLSAPVACGECHLVPSTTIDPGHIDSARPVEVFPPGSGALARTRGAEPIWDRATATCRNTYCHGGGETFEDDEAPSRVDVLDWTGFATGQVFCGSCHGAPPSNFPHTIAPFELEDCAMCHPRTVDPFGNIQFLDGQTRHMDGVVDFGTGDGS